MTSAPYVLSAAARMERPRSVRYGAEGQQRRVLEHEGHSQHEEDLHLVRRVDDALHEHALYDEAEEEEGGRAHDEAGVGIDTAAGGHQPRQVHPPHHHVAVGEVHHAHDAEDEREPDGHEAEHAAEQHAVEQALRDEGRVDRQALGRGNTNFCRAASFGQTATGFAFRIWTIVGMAFGLSPVSLKWMGPPYCMRPAV